MTIPIDCAVGRVVLDWTGTGAMVYGNCNAPSSVTYSAVIYCLRFLVSLDIPLNQGCLAPVSVVLPSGECGVVGGNGLTSQRITDVIIKALGAAAASVVLLPKLRLCDCVPLRMQ